MNKMSLTSDDHHFNGYPIKPKKGDSKDMTGVKKVEPKSLSHGNSKDMIEGFASLNIGNLPVGEIQISEDQLNELLSRAKKVVLENESEILDCGCQTDISYKDNMKIEVITKCAKHN